MKKTYLHGLLLGLLGFTSLSYASELVFRSLDGAATLEHVSLAETNLVFSGDNSGSLHFGASGEFNIHISQSDSSWYVSIDGLGQSITLDADSMIFTVGNVDIALRNCTLDVHVSDAINISSVLQLDNVSMVMHEECALNSGALHISNYADFSGGVFTIGESSGGIVVQNDSTLKVSPNATLAFTRMDSASLQLTNATSQLFLDGCTLDGGSAGIYLSTGTLTCDQSVTLKVGSEAGAEVLIASSVNFNVLEGAEITIVGASALSTPAAPGDALLVGDYFTLSPVAADGNAMYLFTDESTGKLSTRPGVIGDINSYTVYAFESSSSAYPAFTPVLSEVLPPASNRAMLKAYTPSTHEPRHNSGLMIMPETVEGQPEWHEVQHVELLEESGLYRPFFHKTGGSDGDFIRHGDTVRVVLGGMNTFVGHGYLQASGSHFFELFNKPVYGYYSGDDVLSDAIPGDGLAEWKVCLEKINIPLSF